ncbi:MAG: holo-[acyl-carrier-protein] synthase [Alphaproteobacteria bacterium]|nr:holo-[acyl-carrier-protein] synthase [Alphaproteobacteria bacterium]
MIIGLGTDVVNIGRVERTCARYGKRFSEKLFTLQEQKDIEAIKESLRPYKMAKLFAAKEAAAKALGSGFSGGIAWSDIEVGHDKNGRPLLFFYNKALLKIKSLVGDANYSVWLSLSDDYPMAQAVVVIEKF